MSRQRRSPADQKNVNRHIVDDRDTFGAKRRPASTGRLLNERHTSDTQKQVRLPIPPLQPDSSKISSPKIPGRRQETPIIDTNTPEACEFCFNTICDTCVPIDNSANPVGYSKTIISLSIHYSTDTIKALYDDDMLKQQELLCPACNIEGDKGIENKFHRYLTTEGALLLFCPNCVKF